MLHKCARFFLAAVLTVALCPVVAFADEGGSSSGGTGNPLQDLFYMVVGYSGADDEVDTQSSSLPLYTNELKAPSPSKDLSELTSANDLVDGGILLGSGKYLYYLREASFPTADGGSISAYRTFERYSLESGTWETMPSLPFWMEYCSAAVFGATATSEGQIVLLGTPMTTDGNVPTHAASPTASIYTFNPGEESPQWLNDASITDVPVAGSLVNNGGILEIVGGIRNGSPSDAITSYELLSGASHTVGQLERPVVGAQTVPHNGDLYVYSYASTLDQLQKGEGTPQLSIFSKESGSNRTSAFPPFAQPESMDQYPSQGAVMSGSLTSADQGAVFVGPRAESDGSDTYVLKWQESSFSPYSQVLSNNPVCGVAATVYAGNLYAVASVLDSAGSNEEDTGSDEGTGSDEDNGDQPTEGTEGVEGDMETAAAATGHMVFRSTPMVNASVVSGSSGIWRQGSTAGLTFVFSPDYGRFKHIVSVDGQNIVVGGEYESASGTTVITLKPNFLAKLALGSHSITAYFDDMATEVTTSFSIEGEASVIPESNGNGGAGNGNGAGYNSPAALAPTSDPISVIPLTALALVATVLALVAFRRKSSSF